MQHQNSLKILFLGTSIQKTRLYRKLRDWKYNRDGIEDSPPIAPSFIYKKIQHRQRQISFQLWETPQNEKFFKIIRLYMRRKDGYIFIYDVDEKYSFEILQKIVDDVKIYGDFTKAKLLIGFQARQSRIISKWSGALFAKQNDMMFEEITLQQSEASVLDIFGKFSDEIQIRSDIKITPLNLLDEDKKLERKQYIAQIKRLNEAIDTLRRSNMNLRASNEELSYIQIQMRVKNQQISKKIEEMTTREDILSKQVINARKIFQKIIEPINHKRVAEILGIINLYEADALLIRQRTEQIQREFDAILMKLNAKCKTLEHICDEFEGITINNLGQKIRYTSELYRKYKQKQQFNISLEYGSRQEESRRLSNILKQLDISQILQQ